MSIPREFQTNPNFIAPDVKKIEKYINVNGTNALRRGQVASFSLPVGANTGYFQRGSGYITGRIRVDIDAMNGGTYPGFSHSEFRGIVNAGYNHPLQTKFDPGMAFIERPQFKFHNASHLKKNQKVTVNGLSVYQHTSQNVKIEAEQSLVKSEFTDDMIRGMNNSDFKPAFTEFENLIKVVNDTAGHTKLKEYNNSQMEWNFVMKLDCPLFDHDTQDFPLYKMNGTLNYEMTFEDDCRFVFDVRCSQVSDFTVHDLQLHYTSLLPGGEYEMQTMNTPYNISFKSFFTGYQSSQNGRMDFRQTQSCESMVGIMCVPYLLMKPAGMKPLFALATARPGEIGFAYKTQLGVTIEAIDAVIRGFSKGLGVYGGKYSFPTTYQMMIDASPYFAREWNPRDEQGVVSEYTQRFIDAHLQQYKNASMSSQSDHPTEYDGILGPDNVDVNINYGQMRKDENSTLISNVSKTNVLAFDTRIVSDNGMDMCGIPTLANITTTMTNPDLSNSQIDVTTNYRGSNTKISQTTTGTLSSLSDTSLSCNIIGFLTDNASSYQSAGEPTNATARFKAIVEKYIYFFVIHERNLVMNGGAVQLSRI